MSNVVLFLFACTATATAASNTAFGPVKINHGGLMGSIGSAMLRASLREGDDFRIGADRREQLVHTVRK
jgi:hypothetical protein